MLRTFESRKDLIGLIWATLQDKNVVKPRGKPKALSPVEAFQGKFTWRIDAFTRLKDLLKKRKITGLCIKSRRFQVGMRDCRLIVYPRGKLNM